MQPLVQEVAAPDFSKWEMGYKDLVLKKQIGSGQGGIVLLGCLKREGTSKTVTDYIAKERLVSGCKCLLVAVKRFRGETVTVGGLMLPYNVIQHNIVLRYNCAYIFSLSNNYTCIIIPSLTFSTQGRGCGWRWTTFALSWQ